MSGSLDVSPSPLGINNRDDSKAGVFQPASEGKPQPPMLVEAVNVDALRTGYRRRQGATKVRTLTDGHSGFSLDNYAYYVNAGTLYQFNPDGTDTAILSGLSSGFLDADLAGDTIYCSDGAMTFTLSGTTTGAWGVQPCGAPVVSRVAGSLPAGRYLVATTALIGDLEGGATAVTAIDIGSSGALSIKPTNIDPAATSVICWVSEADGETLFFAGEFPVGTCIVNHASGSDQPFESLSIYPPPPGHLVRYWRGRVIVATDLPGYGMAIWFSEPGGYHRFNFDTDFIQLPGRPVLLEPMDDGFYLAVEGGPTWWYAGADPLDLSVTQVDTLPVMEGRAVRVPARKIPKLQSQIDTPVPVWACSDGFVVGLPGGFTRHLTDDRLAMDAHQSAAYVARDIEGAKQLLLAARTKTGSSVGFGDYSVLTVTKGGIPI
jgi:hypothetical protein